MVWLLLEGQFTLALWIFAIAGASDALDGFLAKRYGWESRLGGLLDPLADKILLVSAFLCLAWLDFIPNWLVMLVIGRDLMIVTGAFIYNFQVEELEAAPSYLSKFNTLIQILMVISIMIDKGMVALPEMLLSGMIYLTLITTVLSGLHYVYVWTAKAKAHGPKEG